ncbi:MAG: CoA-binding protein [Sorangiineae bacterium NIC37A_2]|jgi:predicted CoA-binding protein|nr:MAG: CoA-binding protein [Sorangiineae bacterium NIC37A_2]
MAHENPSEKVLYELLDKTKTIAVVGASSNPERPSYGIFRRLLAHGFTVIPVNPKETEVHGQKAYPTLDAVPVPIDLVNVFRRSIDTPSVAEGAVRVGAKALWLQSGISNDETARIAESAGLTVVMDLCIGVEISMLGVPAKGSVA